MKQVVKLQVGESLIYHTGNLSKDRRDDEKLDELAREIYKRSTMGCINPSEKFDPVKGTGEFELSQVKKYVEITEEKMKHGRLQVLSRIVPFYDYVVRRIKFKKKKSMMEDAWNDFAINEMPVY